MEIPAKITARIPAQQGMEMIQIGLLDEKGNPTTGFQIPVTKEQAQKLWDEVDSPFVVTIKRG
jgi:hypothetical protein